MKAYQFLKEKKKWEDAGSPIRTAEEIEAIHKICSECPLFKLGGGWIPGYDRCGKCGCNLHPSHHIFNKIAWGTTRCPDDPPRWIESEPKK